MFLRAFEFLPFPRLHDVELFSKKKEKRKQGDDCQSRDLTLRNQETELIVVRSFFMKLYRSKFFVDNFSL